MVFILNIIRMPICFHIIAHLSFLLVFLPLLSKAIGDYKNEQDLNEKRILKKTSYGCSC